MPRTGPSLKARFAAAIVLTIGFYALALVMAGALLAAAILPWVLGDGFNLFITITCFVLGVTILVAVFPRRMRFEAPGVRVAAADQPRLIELIDVEASRLGERAPDEVYVTFEVNASVLELGRRRRVMIVGLPLLHLVSERGLRAVLAHEYGHYAGGDTRLGPWIYRTRGAIGRTIEHLSDADGDESWSQQAVRLPFIWYGKAFLRITNAISRREEFAADAIAAGGHGRDVHVAALRRIHAFAPAFDAYWANEVVPVLQAGRRPPVAAGFSAFLRTDTIERAAAEQLEHELQEAVTDPYDSHPSLAERIAAVEHCAPGDPDSSPPAAEVLRDAAVLERGLTAHLFGADAAAELEPVDWEAVGSEVHLTQARALAGAHGDLLGAATAGDLAEHATALGPLAGQLQDRESELAPELAPDAAATLLSDALLVALAESGWTVEARPAEPVAARRGDARVFTRVVVEELRSGALLPEAWQERAAGLGIADMPLRPAAREQPAERQATA